MKGSAIVFDAYGTLFDVAGAARAAADLPGHAALQPLWPALAEDWRRKQLEYTWLRRIMGAHADFAQVTADALDWVLDRHGMAAETELRAILLALYDTLPAYPDVAPALQALRAQGARLAILSNGTPAMLDSAIRSAGLQGCFEAVLSVEEVGAFKPDPQVYALVEQRLGVAPGRTVFVSSNGWDVAGAARFGFVSLWVNRARLPADRLPAAPAAVLSDLSGLAGHLERGLG